jgi:hypothetical protein
MGSMGQHGKSSDVRFLRCGLKWYPRKRLTVSQNAANLLIGAMLQTGS